MADGLNVGRFVIDPRSGDVSAGGERLDLGDVERRLILELVRRSPDVVSREALTAALWPDGLPDGSRALDMAWSRLRKRLDGDGALRTVRGGGYAIVPDRAVPSAAPDAGSTRFVGFAAELARARVWARGDGRWLTITGLGGVGKTRLAGELARQLEGHRPIWVALAPIADDDAAVRRTATRLGLDPAPGADVDAAIASACAHRDALVFLDNLEHLPEAARRLAAAFARCPSVRVIATSRRILGVPGEVTHALTGLADDAPALYAELIRASQVDPDPEALEPDFVRLVCDAAAGHPLTLELAVATLRRRPAAALRDPLRHRPARIRGERTGRDERHASFEAVFDYSWALLDEADRGALAALSLFAGPFSAADAEAALGILPETLRALGAQSLLAVDRAGDYALHPLIREVAGLRLDVRDPGHHARRRFRVALLGWLGDVAAGVRSDDPETLRTIDRRLPDLSAAWADAVAARDPAALALAWPGARAWLSLRGEVRVAVRWCGAALSVVDDEALRVDVAATWADALLMVGRPAEARALFEPRPPPDLPAAVAARAWGALARARASAADKAGTEAALAEAGRLADGLDEVELEVRLATLASYSALGRSDLGEADARRAEALARATGNQPLLRRALSARATRLTAQSRFAEGVAAATEAAQLADEAADHACAFGARTVRAVGLRCLGRFDEALPLFVALQEEVAQRGAESRLAYLTQQEAIVRMDLGQLDAAEHAMRRALAIAERYGQAKDQSNTLIQLANLQFVRGRHDDALATMAQRKALTEGAGLTDAYNRMLNAHGVLPAALFSGRNDLARREVAFARDLAREHGLAESVWWQNSLFYALVEANDGDGPAAARYALDALTHASSPWLVHRSLFLLGLVLARLGETALAAGLVPVLRGGKACVEQQVYLPYLELALGPAATGTPALGDEAPAALRERFTALAQVSRT